MEPKEPKETTQAEIDALAEEILAMPSGPEPQISWIDGQDGQ